MLGMVATARTPDAAGGTCLFGDLPAELALDGTLAGVWQPAMSPLDVPPLAKFDLRAREGLHDPVRWFDDPLSDEPDELVGRGCRLLRSNEGGTITGTCHPTATGIRHALRFGSQPVLLRNGWLLVHACAIELDDGVHVFAAPSGTGKSTLARRAAAAGHQVSCDEVVLVTPGRAAAHPAQAFVVDTSPKPLAALHFLGRGEASRCAVSLAEACARLLSLAMVYERSGEAAHRAFALAQEIVESVPAFSTTVPDDERALDVLREARR